jgi:hypothetical protein
MMARFKTCLRVTSSAAVISYKYSYDDYGYTGAVANGNSQRVGYKRQHNLQDYPLFLNVSQGGVKGKLGGCTCLTRSLVFDSQQ